MSTFHSLQVPAASLFPTLTGHLMPEDACRAASDGSAIGPHRVAVGAGPAGLRDAARLPNQTADGNTVRRFSSIRRTLFPARRFMHSAAGHPSHEYTGPEYRGAFEAGGGHAVRSCGLDITVGAPPPRSWLALLRMAGPVNAAHPHSGCLTLLRGASGGWAALTE